MLLNCEQWRKDFGVDDIVECVLLLLTFIDRCPHLGRRNFDFEEKEQVDKYYPQYYHKMDKVRILHPHYILLFTKVNKRTYRTADRSTSSDLASWTSKTSTPSPRKIAKSNGSYSNTKSSSQSDYRLARPRADTPSKRPARSSTSEASPSPTFTASRTT